MSAKLTKAQRKAIEIVRNNTIVVSRHSPYRGSGVERHWYTGAPDIQQRVMRKLENMGILTTNGMVHPGGFGPIREVYIVVNEEKLTQLLSL